MDMFVVRRHSTHMSIRAQLALSSKPRKKFHVTVTFPDKTQKKIHFGDKRYGDYTKSHNNDRKSAYLTRHEPNEDWSLKGIDTAGFWARWILWNQKTVRKSIKDLNRRFYNELRVMF